jgi:hypothetical protein
MNATWPGSAMCSVTHARKEKLHGKPWRSSYRLFFGILWSPRPMHPSSFSCASPLFVNLRARFLLRGRAVTPRVMLFSNYLHYKLNQALSVMVNQVTEVQNQNSKSRVRIWGLKFCLVWTDILSQQIFRIYQSRICFPWLILQVCKTERIMEVIKYLFRGYKQSKSTQFQT